MSRNLYVIDETGATVATLTEEDARRVIVDAEGVGPIRAERDLLRHDAAELWWALRDLLDATYDGPPEVIANAGRVLAECCYGSIEEWDAEEEGN